MQPGQPLTDYHHIDPSQLLEAVGGDAGTVASLARTFIDSAPAIFARLEQAAQEGNAERSRHESHSLKGMSAMFQAQVLTMLLQQTEQAARNGQTPRPEELVQLQASFALVLDEIGRCARSLPRS
ncbi:Hpt domain-containing protein [Herbaspirillum huttiense]|uniref:Hpt domain-containing protein n=1 Tax=Herbaspirillum huttiense TaxID=863372 RepID=UPI0039AF8936